MKSNNDILAKRTQQHKPKTATIPISLQIAYTIFPNHKLWLYICIYNIFALVFFLSVFLHLPVCYFWVNSIAIWISIEYKLSEVYTEIPLMSLHEICPFIYSFNTVFLIFFFLKKLVVKLTIVFIGLTFRYFLQIFNRYRLFEIFTPTYVTIAPAFI